MLGIVFRNQKGGNSSKTPSPVEKTCYEFWCILIDSFHLIPYKDCLFERYDCASFQVQTFNDRCPNPPTIKLAIEDGVISTAGWGLVLRPCHASELHLSLVLPAWSKKKYRHSRHLHNSYGICKVWAFYVTVSACNWPTLWWAKFFSRHLNGQFCHLSSCCKRAN